MMQFNLAYEQPAGTETIQTFETSLGARIFQLPLEAFPGFWAYAYLVLVDDWQVLIDTGSGFGSSNDHLVARLLEVDEVIAEPVGLSHLTHVLITHGHIDHFGGLTFIRENSPAWVGVHELDLRNLTNTEERITLVSKRLNDFLIEAGISDELRDHLIKMYHLIKLDYVPVAVDFTYEAVGMQLGPFAFLHVPGHCAGQVVIQLHDVLFSGDHVLSEISPHQAPERLVLNTGLGHYLQSLDTLQNWATNIHLTLGGHNPPVTDLFLRLEEIRKIHHERLQKILEILTNPQTINDVSRMLFKDVHGYNVLLALEETGAHVEYLSQRGRLAVANLSELDQANPAPILYQTLEQSNVLI